MRRMVRASLIVFCAFFIFQAYSQNQRKADSLRYLIDHQVIDKEKQLEVYYWLTVYSASPDDELKYGKYLLELAEADQNKEYIIKANQLIGVAHRFMGNLDKALEYLFESAHEAASNKELEPLLVDVYIEISSCYTQNNDSENALLYGLKAVDILRKSDRKQDLAINLLNIGYDYYLIADYDSAMIYYNESEPIFEEINMLLGRAYVIGNRALVYWKQGDRERAKSDLFKAIEMLEPLGDQFAIADYYNKLGEISFEEQSREKAIRYSLTSLEIASKEGLKEQIRDASHLLFLLYQEAGEFEKANRYQTQYHAYKDSIQNLQSTQKLANLRTQFEVGQKQAEVDLLLEQKRSNQIIMITGGIMLVVVICVAILIFYYSKSKTRLNRQLKEQKDSLISLNNTKDKFFSIISHDLRGPVGVLNGLVFVIKKEVENMNTPELKEILDRMEHSASHLVKLLDNLLHWALQQRGQFPYAPENLSIRGILAPIGDLFKDMASSKNIRLDMQLDEDFTIVADKNAASTIFRNLLNNAIKFTPDGGHIRVVTESNNGAELGVIRFIDNGVGIPGDKLKILFNLNEAISTKGTSGESGLGLGLQLVYELIQLHNGEIEVESEVGKGTTFTVSLPLSNQ